MPELPEVETIRAGLSRLIIGKKISSVSFDWPKGFPNSDSDVNAFFIGSTITDVRRRAKVLLIDLSTKYTLVIHLKMTGQLVFIKDNKVVRSKSKVENGSQQQISELRFGAGHPNDSLVGKLPDKSTRVIFTFSDGSHLYFNDQRKFGWVRLMPSIEVDNLDFFKTVGPEPLSDEFTPKIFMQRIMRRKGSTIKAVLLDQTVLAGIGNIYADESLWGAKIHPSTLVRDVSKPKLKTLYEEIRYVLRQSIEKGGSTDRNYVDSEGKKGSYLKFARVFRRENLPCSRCGTTIVKTRVAGRGTHTCPKCQVH